MNTCLDAEEEYDNKSVHFLEFHQLKQITNPSFLFQSEDEIKAFIQLYPENASIEDRISALQTFLKECEDEELYEYCQIIINKIKELQNG